MPPTHTTLDLTGTGYCASFHLRRTARAVTRMFDAALQDSGIRSTQFSILVGIAKHQPVAIGALADVMILAPTTLTRSLRPLEKEGLITISERSTMRQRFLSMTPKGERALERSVVVWRKAHEHFLSRWVLSIGMTCGKSWNNSLAWSSSLKNRGKTILCC